MNILCCCVARPNPQPNKLPISPMPKKRLNTRTSNQPISPNFMTEDDTVSDDLLFLEWRKEFKSYEDNTTRFRTISADERQDSDQIKGGSKRDSSTEYHKSRKKQHSSRKKNKDHHSRKTQPRRPASSDVYSTDEEYGRVDRSLSMRLDISVSSINDRNRKMTRSSSMSSISYLAHALPNENWSLLDEIRDHFCQSDGYDDMTHILSEKSLCQTKPQNVTKISMAEETKNTLIQADDRFTSVGTELMRCQDGVTQCSEVINMLKEDVQYLNTMNENQVKTQLNETTHDRDEIRKLKDQVRKLATTAENMGKKLHCIKEAETNEAILDAYLRLNQMLTDIKAEKQMNKSSVEAWSMYTSEAALQMKSQMDHYKKRAELLESDLRRLSEEHQYMLSVVSGGDQPFRRTQERRTWWEPNLESGSLNSDYYRQSTQESRPLYPKPVLIPDTKSSNNQVLTVERRSSNNQVLTVERRSSNNQVLTVERRPSNNQVLTVEKRPSNNQVLTVERRSTNNQVLTVERRPSNNQVLITKMEPSDPNLKQPTQGPSAFKGRDDFNQSSTISFRDWYNTDFQIRRELLKQRIKEMSERLGRTRHFD
ncbi:uncharacterized protein LOC121379895 [Gigantopelta aegis]|uniref:uncharacterized protein LOC121379895 n=1 Tax=Gigantopelta aegis TaxID=1735272 RepID=UPI001B888806|nr:uncharacterized protein LOC121379895 [Gigantopelta aegis]